MDEDLQVVPLHKHAEYLMECCSLINAEWQRSTTARLRSLESSCDFLPVNLILLKNKQVIGHLKLSKIPSIKNACFVETVVIKNELRGKGYGTILMKEAEMYCQNNLHLKAIYLSTKGQEIFYEKLGYVVCEPINIFGGVTQQSIQKNDKIICKGPPPPPLPKNVIPNIQRKTYMYKNVL